MTFTELLALDQQGTTRKIKAASRSPGKIAKREDQTARGPEPPAAQSAAPEQRKAETMIPRYRDIIVPDMVQRLRKAVKHLGKEAATYRFTEEEKEALADAVYTYGRQKYRTSENEIVRIGINWLLEEYQASGEESVLHKVLEALHE